MFPHPPISPNPTRSLLAICFVFSLVFNAFAAGEVDPAFNAGVQSNASVANYSTAIQPDGKILVGGNFNVAVASARDAIVRLNADGTVDTTFDVDFGDSPLQIRTVNAIALQSDGKIVVGGDVRNNQFGQTLPFVARLNPNGSRDTSFNPPIADSSFGSVFDLAIDANNRVIIGGSFIIYFSNASRTYLTRLNSDGSIDMSFPLFNIPNIILRSVALQSDGKILVGGSGSSSSTGSLYRLNQNGTVDNGFFTVTANNGSVEVIKPTPDGKIYIGGTFTGINGFIGAGVARINSDGSLDTSFNTNSAGAVNAVYDVEIGADGKIFIGGGFMTYNGATQRKIAKLNSDGSRDPNFAATVFSTSDTVYDVLPLADGRVIAVGNFITATSLFNRILMLTAFGTVDTSFANPRAGRNGTIFEILPLTNGKVIIGGFFDAVNGSRKSTIARLNADGTLDESFVAVIPGNFVYALSQQADGKILVGGQFGVVNGFGRNALVRLNADGSLDTSFNLGIFGISQVRAIAIQQDGKIIIGGFFNGSPSGANAVARLNSDGTLDTTFNAPFFSYPNNSFYIHAIALQPDGKVIVGGDFTQVGSNIRGRIARLNTDGSFDASFNPPGGANDSVLDLALQPDGKIVIGGLFTAVNGVNQGYLARLNPNGALDTSFTPTPNWVVQAVALQPDGKVLIGGNFTFVGGQLRNRIARVNPNGSLDTTFNPGSGTNEFVLDVALQLDGKIYAGGFFTRFNGASRVSIARLLNATVICACIRTPFDFDGDGRADLSVFRPSNSFWYRVNSLNGQFVQNQFGASTDLIAPSDYDGDGKTDLAYFRPAAPDVAAFYILDSSTNTQRQIIFAQAGDLPATGDWDGDGRADAAVYREGIGGAQSYFFYRPSSQPGVNFISIPWGITGDKPVVGDFDGDGKTDAAVFRPSSGAWFVRYSSSGQFFAVQWGASGDLPTPADYDGDGRTDISVFRPSNGTWYRINSSNGSFTGVQFGTSGDIPVAADYDGDGRADVAVWRPATGTWYLLRSTAGFAGIQFGAAGDVPAEAAFVR